MKKVYEIQDHKINYHLFLSDSGFIVEENNFNKKPMISEFEFNKNNVYGIPTNEIEKYSKKEKYSEVYKNKNITIKRFTDPVYISILEKHLKNLCRSDFRI